MSEVMNVGVMNVGQSIFSDPTSWCTLYSNSNILSFPSSNYCTPDNCYIHNPDQNPDQRCPFSGRLAASATLTDATSPSSSQNWSTDGSGRPTRSIYEDQINNKVNL